MLCQTCHHTTQSTLTLTFWATFWQ